MIAKFLLGITVCVVSISCAAQVVSPTTYRDALSTSVGGGMNYWSGDWGRGDINRWGPQAWGTVTIWHDLSMIAEGHSMVVGGNSRASQYKYFTGGGGLIYTSDYWGRFQPFVKGEAGFASLSHPDNFTGHLHDTRNIWTLGGGFEYHNKGNWWTHVGYSYDFFTNFHSSVTGNNPSLNPRGFTFGESYRFGPSGSRY
jgi:opacity protein-like surface antigen